MNSGSSPAHLFSWMILKQTYPSFTALAAPVYVGPRQTQDLTWASQESFIYVELKHYRVR